MEGYFAKQVQGEVSASSCRYKYMIFLNLFYEKWILLTLSLFICRKVLSHRFRLPKLKGLSSIIHGSKYHIPEFQNGSQPIGLKEVFNHVHSSLQNVIECSFGVLKMKWRILLDVLSYPIDKQKENHNCLYVFT
jgi:hypothetical protein